MSRALLKRYRGCAPTQRPRLAAIARSVRLAHDAERESRPPKIGAEASVTFLRLPEKNFLENAIFHLPRRGIEVASNANRATRPESAAYDSRKRALFTRRVSTA
jgi:hypothetical protein